MEDAFRAEWTKLRTLASTGWLLLATVTLTVGVSAAVTAANNYSSTSPSQDTTKLALAGVDLGQAIVALLAVLAISEEYGTGMIRVTLTAIPRRLGLLSAKAANIAGLTLVVGILAVTGCLLAGRLHSPRRRFRPRPTGMRLCRSHTARPSVRLWAVSSTSSSSACSPSASPPPYATPQSRSAPCSPCSTCPSSWPKSSATRYDDTSNRSHRWPPASPSNPPPTSALYPSPPGPGSASSPRGRPGHSSSPAFYCGYVTHEAAPKQAANARRPPTPYCYTGRRP